MAWRVAFSVCQAIIDAIYASISLESFFNLGSGILTDLRNKNVFHNTVVKKVKKIALLS